MNRTVRMPRWLPLLACTIASVAACGRSPHDDGESEPYADMPVAVPQRNGQAAPREVTDPVVLAFVRRTQANAAATEVLAVPEQRLVVFDAYFPDAGYPGEGEHRRGMRFGDRIGWIGEGDGAPDGFQIRREDTFLFSPRFARLAQEKTKGSLWEPVFATAIANNPASPRASLLLVARTAPTLHRALLANPTAAGELEIVTAMRNSGGIYPSEWLGAMLPIARRALAADTASRATVEAFLPLLRFQALPGWVGEALLRQRAAGRDTSVLLAVAKLEGADHGGARRTAMERLFALEAPPRALWMELPWWEAHPEWIRDARVRRDTAVLHRLHWNAATRSAADSLLLADPATDAETVNQIAMEIAGNLRQCRPYPYPSRERALAALAHPAAARDSSIAISLIYVYGIPDVRRAAYRRLTGQTLPADKVAPRVPIPCEPN